MKKKPADECKVSSKPPETREEYTDLASILRIGAREL